MTKELGIWGFGWLGLSSVSSVLWLLLNTSLWQGLLVTLVEMRLVMRGRKLSPLCYPRGSAVEEWQLCADTKPGHSQTAQERILALEGDQLLAVRAVNAEAVPSQCSCLPATGAVLGLVLLFMAPRTSELQEQRLPYGSCCP